MPVAQEDSPNWSIRSDNFITTKFIPQEEYKAASNMSVYLGICYLSMIS